MEVYTVYPNSQSPISVIILSILGETHITESGYVDKP